MQKHVVSWESKIMISTGLVSFQCIGTEARNIQLLMAMRTVKYVAERIFSVFGPVGQNPVPIQGNEENWGL